MAAFAWRRFAALVFVNVVYIVPLLSVLYAANDKLIGEPAAKHGEVSRTGAMLAVDPLLSNPTLPLPLPLPLPRTRTRARTRARTRTRTRSLALT